MFHREKKRGADTRFQNSKCECAKENETEPYLDGAHQRRRRGRARSRGRRRPFVQSAVVLHLSHGRETDLWAFVKRVRKVVGTAVTKAHKERERDKDDEKI